MTRTYLSDQSEEDELLNPEEVRKTLKVGDKTLYRYRRDDVLHPVVLNSRTYRYRKSEISRLIQHADSTTACQKSQEQTVCAANESEASRARAAHKKKGPAARQKSEAPLAIGNRDSELNQK